METHLRLYELLQSTDTEEIWTKDLRMTYLFILLWEGDRIINKKPAARTELSATSAQ